MLDSSVAAVDLRRNQTGCRVKPGVVFVTREIQLGGHTLFWTLGTFSQLNRKHNESYIFQESHHLSKQKSRPFTRPGLNYLVILRSYSSLCRTICCCRLVRRLRRALAEGSA